MFDIPAEALTEGYSYSGIPKVLAYDNDLFDLYTPDLESGSADECVSGMSNIGDKLKLGVYSMSGEETELDLNVSGVLADKSKLLASDKFNTLTVGCKDMLSTYYRALDAGQGRNTLILKADDLKNEGVLLVPSGFGIVRYNNNISQEAVESNERILNSVGGYASFQKVRENTLDDIYSQLLVIAPIIIMLVLTVLLCIVSTSAIKAKRQMQGYAIFALCGARRRRLFLIGLTETAVCVITALMLSRMLYVIAPHISLTSDLILKTDFPVIAAVILIALLTLAASAIISFVMTNRLPIKTQLYRER